jgi:hypothetical protein
MKFFRKIANFIKVSIVQREKDKRNRGGEWEEGDQDTVPPYRLRGRHKLQNNVQDCLGIWDSKIQPKNKCVKNWSWRKGGRGKGIP